MQCLPEFPCFNSGRAKPFYYDLHCTCYLPVDLCWRTELQIYRNCTSYISSSGYYLFKYRRPAKPAIFERLSAKRILAFLEPEKYASDEAYQQNNSEMAIGSGQLTGKGLNNNTTTSVKNGNYISEPQTDFIFAIIGEELGFVGCCIIIALLLLVVIQCILIGMRSRDLAGKIICSGVGGLIGFQSFINISVATNMLPNTGVPLPFISYGLTSLVSLYIGIGFVLNVGLQQKKYQ